MSQHPDQQNPPSTPSNLPSGRATTPTPIRSAFLAAMGVLFGASALLSSACGPASDTPISSGAGAGGETCGTPQEGCPCSEPGVTVACSNTESYTPGADTAKCLPGERTCSGGQWGACVENGQHTFQSVPPLKLQGASTPCVNNPCDPGCNNFTDDQTAVPTGPGTGIIAADGGGITLDPDGGVPGGAGSGCINLQCQINACNGQGGYAATKITGAVYDPAGLNPIPNVLVYIPNSNVADPQDGVSCDTCSTNTGSPIVSVITDYKGEFTLSSVPSGANIPIVINSGKWQRKLTIPSVTACTTTNTNNLNGSDGKKLIRFPKNRSEGSIPRIAFVSGSADPFQCVLSKMGMDVTAATSEVGVPVVSGAINADRIHYYQSPNSAGQNLSSSLGGGAPSANTLWGGAAAGASCTANSDCSSGTCTSTSLSGVTNGTFETGSLSGWTTSAGTTAVSTTQEHGGSYSALLGYESKNGTVSANDHTLTQTFTAPAGAAKMSLWYYHVCNDNVAYDWITATLKNNTTNNTVTILSPVCNSTAAWREATGTVVPGNSYTLTVTNHIDNNNGDRSWTYLDDVTLTGAGTCTGTARLDIYDAVILACEGNEYDKGATVNQALVDYAARGGRLFATHYSYSYVKNAPSATLWPQVAFPQPWNDDQSYPSSPLTTYINRAFPKGDTFAKWLNHTGASTTLGQLPIVEGRHDYDYVNSNYATPWLKAQSNNSTSISGTGTRCAFDADCANTGLECTGSGTCQDGTACVADGGGCGGTQTQMCSGTGQGTCSSGNTCTTLSSTKVCATMTANGAPAGNGTACTATTAGQGTCTDAGLTCNGGAGKCQDGSSCTSNSTCGTRTEACKVAGDCTGNGPNVACSTTAANVCTMTVLSSTGTTVPPGVGTDCTSSACTDNGTTCVVDNLSGNCSNLSTTTCTTNSNCSNLVSTAIANTTFDSNLNSWTQVGAPAASTTQKHSGTRSARIGNTTNTTSPSSIAQTFTAPGNGTLSFWYYNDCNDTVANDYFTATLDATVIQAPICTTGAAKVWKQVTGIPVTSGTSYTLKFTNVQNGSGAGTRSATYIDDVVLTTSGTCDGVSSTCQQKSTCTPGNDSTCGTNQYCAADNKCKQKTAVNAVGKCDTSVGLCTDGATACTLDSQCGALTMKCTGTAGTQGNCPGTNMKCQPNSALANNAGTPATYNGICAKSNAVGVCDGLTCAAKSCSTDAECTAAQVCSGGTCQQSINAVGKCYNGKCPDDSVCTNDGQCGTQTKVCSTDADCGGGREKCIASNVVSGYTKVCTTTLNGSTVVGSCAGPTCTARVCTTDDDCGGMGYRCNSGSCVEYDMEPLMTFNVPVGVPAANQCGRVVFSDFHVSASALNGSYSTFPEGCNTGALSAQEKALEYMIFDLTACLTPDYNPQPPGVQYQSVTVTRDYVSACEQGFHPIWHAFDWMTHTPNDSSIQFAASTGETLATLAPSTPILFQTVSGAPVTVWTGKDIDTVLTTNGLTSGKILRISITLNPTSDHLYAPTLDAWRQSYDCVPTE